MLYLKKVEEKARERERKQKVKGAFLCVAMYDPNNSSCSAEDSPTTPDAKMSRNKFNLQLPPGAVIAAAAAADDSSPASICDE